MHDVRLTLAIDSDDRQSGLAAEQLRHWEGLAAIQIEQFERPLGLGELHNAMAGYTRSDAAFLLWSDRIQVITPGWDQALALAAMQFPKRVLWLDSVHLAGPGQFILPPAWRAAQGPPCPAIYPFWFEDSAVEEIDAFVHGFPRVAVDAKCAGARRLSTTRCRDLPFWINLYAAQRPQRIEDSRRIADALGVTWQERPDVLAYFETRDRSFLGARADGGARERRARAAGCHLSRRQGAGGETAGGVGRMRILVTGAGGYLGSMLVPRLLHRDWRVTAFDLFPRGMPFLAACCADRNLDIVNGDIRELDAATLGRHDLIINLAAIVGAPACDRDPVNSWHINCDAVERVCSLLSRRQMLIQPTSDSGYGVGYATEMCTEQSPLNPVSLYGRSKVEAEKSVLAFGGVSLRLASVFGMSPRMRLDLMVNEFVWRAVQDRSVVLFESHFRRNFVHIRDVVSAFLHAIDNYDAMRGEAFNCGLTSANMTKRQLCEKIAEHVPGFEFYESASGVDPDRRDYVVSNAEAGSDRLGAAPHARQRHCRTDQRLSHNGQGSVLQCVKSAGTRSILRFPNYRSANVTDRKR